MKFNELGLMAQFPKSSFNDFLKLNQTIGLFCVFHDGCFSNDAFSQQLS